MISRLLRGASNVLGLAAGCAVILMMLHINLDVAMRYIFSAPFANTIEIVSTYYIVAIVFLQATLSVAATSPMRYGAADHTSATVPATCGPAMDVPLL